MHRKLSLIAAVTCLSVLVASCQTDRVTYKIGKSEKFISPVGLFPEGFWNKETRRANAIGHVVDDFQKHPENLEGDPARTLHTMALFEWLANDLRDNLQVAPYKIRKVLDARGDLREAIGIDSELSTKDSISQLMSMSKFLALTMSDDSSDPPDIRQRRKLLNKLKSHAWNILKGSAEVAQSPAAGDVQ